MHDDEYFPFSGLRARIAQLALEGREHERERAAWELADRIARIGGASFNPHRSRRRVRYPVIEAM